MLRWYLDWRARVLTDERRDCLGKWVLIITVVVMVAGFWSQIFAQTIVATQDAINATLTERQYALSARLDKIETMVQFIIFGVFGNLIASLFQLTKSRSR